MATRPPVYYGRGPPRNLFLMKIKNGQFHLIPAATLCDNDINLIWTARGFGPFSMEYFELQHQKTRQSKISTQGWKPPILPLNTEELLSDEEKQVPGTIFDFNWGGKLNIPLFPPSLGTLSQKGPSWETDNEQKVPSVNVANTHKYFIMLDEPVSWKQQRIAAAKVTNWVAREYPQNMGQRLTFVFGHL